MKISTAEGDSDDQLFYDDLLEDFRDDGQEVLKNRNASSSRR